MIHYAHAQGLSSFFEPENQNLQDFLLNPCDYIVRQFYHAKNPERITLQKIMFLG